jgi:hypothetical protein
VIAAAGQDAGTWLTEAIADLVERGLAEGRDISAPAMTCRIRSDLALGVFIARAGTIAVRVCASSENPVEPRAFTKLAMVLAMLRRDAGATLAEITTTCCIKPQSTPSVLNNLRKKGHVIERGKRGDETLYRITTDA